MDIEKLLYRIMPDMLPKPYSQYAKAIGIENLYRFVQLTGGKTIYLPKPENCFREALKIMIIEDYASGNFTQHELSLKYQMGEKKIRTYINNNK